MAELPLSLDLTIAANRSYTKRFRWLPGGTPQDFTGWTARLQVRQAPESTVLIELSTEDGGITLSDDGYIDLFAPLEKTLLLEDAVRPRYDLVLRSSETSVTTYLTGVVNVLPYISSVPVAP